MADAQGHLKPGAVVGKWKVRTFIGQGGQAGVWEVAPTTTSHSPRRALKACFSAGATERARFEREVRLLQACSHENIVVVHEANLAWASHVPGAPEFAYFVTERFDGSIRDRKTDMGALPERLGYFRQACSAVAHIHTLPQPVIHRDIKPANFLIGGEPRRLVLADFGIAHVDDGADLTATHEVVGSRVFRAPEVANGGAATEQSDVYSLGRLLEWLLTGDASLDLGIRPLPRGDELSDEACDALERVLTKATAPVAQNRYRSVRELADAVPSLWYSVKPRRTALAGDGVGTSEAILEAAQGFARGGDKLGWRNLENRIRAGYAPSVRQWRSEHEHDRLANVDELLPVVDDLLRRALPRMLLALTGLYSRVDGLTDQRRVIDDLMSIDGWNESGTTVFVYGPRGLVYLFHYLHGALCCEVGDVDAAVRLASAPLPRQSLQDKMAPLWRLHDLTGWPKTLGGDCMLAWKYLQELGGRFPELFQFYGIARDFEVALASYSMLLSVLELATEVGKLLPKGDEPFDLDAPPMFVFMPFATQQAAFRRTLGSRDVVEQVASLAGGSPDQMRSFWPRWREAMVRFRGRVSQGRLYFDGEPLGDLA